jgi:hypothetical protein
MTRIHAQLCGHKALLNRDEFERLVELARRSEQVELQIAEDDLPTAGMMSLAETGGAFDYWGETGEDVYSVHDGEPV